MLLVSWAVAPSCSDTTTGCLSVPVAGRQVAGGPAYELVGLTSYAGDKMGPSLIASQMAASLMNLSFLIQRRYAPYSKWFGTAFSQLNIAARLSDPLTDA